MASKSDWLKGARRVSERLRILEELTHEYAVISRTPKLTAREKLRRCGVVYKARLPELIKLDDSRANKQPKKPAPTKHRKGK